MSNFPTSLDDDISLPPVFDNIVEDGSEAIQAIRSAIFALETEVGIGASGTTGSVANRIDVSIDPSGLIRPAALIGLGLVVLPITNSEISATAGIAESKLNLNYATQFLYNLFVNLEDEVDILQGFVSTVGSEVLPHIAGTAYRHKLSHIDVDPGTWFRANIETGTTIASDTTDGYTLVFQIADDLLDHTRADGVSDNTTPPIGKAHNAAGIYINPGLFNVIPPSTNDLQSFAEYVDSNGLVLLGSRTQTLFANGEPRSLRNTTLTNNAAGEPILDPTPATTFLATINPDPSDNLITLVPTGNPVTTFVVDAQIGQIRPGDYITVNYGNSTAPVAFTIDTISNNDIRIHGKNLFASTYAGATVRVDRPRYHENRFNSLAIASASNNTSNQSTTRSSVVIAAPSGASAIGLGFDPSELSQDCYKLYLELYPTGNPAQETIALPGIDVTGNIGHTPGLYTLETVVNAINRVFRDPSLNYRFLAFTYQGEIGIALSDRYKGASFSIIAGVADSSGSYTAGSNASYPNNVVDNFNAIDPLGFGFTNANIASQPYNASYLSNDNAKFAPTLIFAPFKRNYFYVNGVERDTLDGDVLMTKDGYGDGYWPAILTAKANVAGKIEATYVIGLDLTKSKLMPGKTLVVQPAVLIDSPSYHNHDYGRFIIKTVVFNVNCDCSDSGSQTILTVEDASHGVNDYPSVVTPTPNPNLPVFIYFGNDSLAINEAAPIDTAAFFEIYVKDDGSSFVHERANWTYVASGSVNVEVIDVSPRLRGYATGSPSAREALLQLTAPGANLDIFEGRISDLADTRRGPTSIVKRGEITRIYDETGVDYIDIRMDAQDTPSSPSSLTLSLSPSLQFNQEHIFIGTYQQIVGKLRTPGVHLTRQFGNTSEKQLSTSAINYIAAPQRLLDENGVIRGFDLMSNETLTSTNLISIKGGTALVNGKIVEIDSSLVRIPILKQVWTPGVGPWAPNTISSTMRWYLCVNAQHELEWIASSTFNRTFNTYFQFDLADAIVSVINPRVVEASYNIRSGYFKEVVNTFKDVTPLYVVTSTINDGYNVTTATVKDARRYTVDGHRGLSHRFSFGETASFRTLKSLTTYLNEYIKSSIDPLSSGDVLNSEQLENKVYVTDTIDVSGMDLTFNLDYNFNLIFSSSETNNRYIDLGTKIIFVGDGGKFVVSSAPITVGHNVEFRDITFDVSNDFGVKITGNNVLFDRCRVNYNYDPTLDGYYGDGYLGNVAKGCLYINTTDSINKVNRNIQITNCKFYRDSVFVPFAAVGKYFPFITFVVSGTGSNSDTYLSHIRHCLENIVIDNNRFDTMVEENTYSPTSRDSKRAVIAITSTVVSLSDSPRYYDNRLINCKITNNICNKNHMILMSAPDTGSIQGMLIPINVSIEKNICGSICFLVRQELLVYVGSGFPVNAILDKNNSLVIARNVCKYIFCGTNKGFINVVGNSFRVMDPASNVIASGINIYSASVAIEENVCSWIHVGVKNPQNLTIAYEVPTLKIDSNILSAYNSTFLNDYHSVITPTNVSLIIDNQAGT